MFFLFSLFSLHPILLNKKLTHKSHPTNKSRLFLSCCFFIRQKVQDWCVSYWHYAAHNAVYEEVVQEADPQKSGICE